MKTLWVNFIAKQYKKYYPDPIDDIIKKLQPMKFKSNKELFKFMYENGKRPIKVLVSIATERVERRTKNAGNKCSRNKKTVI